MTFPQMKTLGVALAITALGSPLLAAADNYEFRAGAGEFKAGRGRVISIKADRQTEKEAGPRCDLRSHRA